MHDLGMAQGFIRVLTGDAETSIAWQTFDDKSAKNKRLVWQEDGPIDGYAKHLTRLNKAGAGIFLCVNETKGGHKDDDVTAVRALFADCDKGEPDPAKLAMLPKPSIVVTSRGGPHLYWLMKPGVDVAAFKPAQRIIADHLDSDRVVCNPGRVMRLPGSVNHKRDPFNTAIRTVDAAARYGLEEVIGGLPAPKPKAVGKVAPPARVQVEGSDAVAQARRFVAGFRPAIEGDGGDLQTFKLACELAIGFDLPDSDALPLMRDWNAGCVPPWDERDLETKIRSARKSGKGVPGERLRATAAPMAKPSLELPPAWDEPPPGVKAAVERERVKTESSKGLNPRQLALLVMDKERVICDRQGNLWLYNGKVWFWIDKDGLRSKVFEHDDKEKANARRLTAAADFIMHSVRSWEPVEWNQLGLSEVPFQNGVLDFMTGKMRPHRAGDMLDRVLPHDYVRDAKAPIKWLWFLEYTFGDDPHYMAKVAALQEFMGYIVTRHAKYKKALVLFGPSDTGKSVVMAVMRFLVGGDNTCQIPIDQMGNDSALAPIFGKMLNLLSEIKKGALVDDGGFKQLVSTEEPVLINEKYQKRFSYVPTAKHVFGTNNLPTISDKSDATFNRLLIIKFNKVVPKAEQEPNLTRDLEGEVDGIIGWALVGAKRLHLRQGQFTEVPESSELLKEYRDEQDYLKMFIDEECTKDPEKMVSISTFTLAFNEWLGTRGHWSRANIGKDLARDGFEKARRNNGRFVIGIYPTNHLAQTEKYSQGRSNLALVTGVTGK